MSRTDELLDSAPDAIVLVDQGGQITFVNRRTEELFGYSRSKLLGERVELLVPERFRKRHLTHRAGYVADPQTREMGADLDLYGLRSDGSEFPVEISLSPTTDAQGSQVITIIRDVTERRSAEARFRVLLESAPDAIMLVDTGGLITLANRRAEELFGYQQGELIGGQVELLVPERFRSGHLDHRADYAAHPDTREMGPGLQLFGLRKDASEFPVEIGLSPMTVGSEELAITSVRDVSERRAAELERLELAREQAAHAAADAGRERLESILSEVDVIVWEADVKRRRFSFVSKRAEDMLGYPISAWLEDDDFWRGIVEPEDLPLAELYFQEAIGRASDHDYVYRVNNSDGQTVWVRDRVRAVRDGDGELRLRGVTGDITDHRELEERLLQSQKMDAVGQLAGGVAHDFNNLLVVISGYTELLLGRVTDDESLVQLREINQAAGRAGELIAQLLAFGRRAPNIDELVDLSALIRGIEPMLRRLIDEDIGLVLEIPEALSRVRADPGQLEQVLVNLVINARDAMPLGGEIRIQITERDLDETEASELGLLAGRCVVLSVTDNGSGMTNETKARVFEPFFTTKELGKGTGLGLATIYGIVEQAGGKIAIDTELGRGSTFSVYLLGAPLTEEPEVEDQRGIVLVVEDEPAVRRLVRTVLEDGGYRIREAANGREALEYLERGAGHVDLILTDVVMPDITGPELVARLAPLEHAIPVLFMSGYADTHLLNRGVNQSTIGVLRKPFTGEQLTTRVAEVLTQQQAHTLPA
jgi:two-component system cell cycle sensor histidine kinase/response regulator CckA